MSPFFIFAARVASLEWGHLAQNRFCKIYRPSKPDSCYLWHEPADRRHGRDDRQRRAAGDPEGTACTTGRTAVDTGRLHAGGGELSDAGGIYLRPLRASE